MTQAASLQSPQPATDAAFERWVLVGVLLAYALASTALSLMSDGFEEMDGIVHYMYARDAPGTPAYFVDVWGRPLWTLLHAPGAWLAGVSGVRATSLLIALGCAVLAVRIARQLGHRAPVLAAVAFCAQPLTFIHSASELTELLFALLLSAATLLYVGWRWFWLAVVMGLAPAARPEGFPLLLVTAVALVCHRRWFYLPLLVVPLLVWNHAGWVLFGRPQGYWLWLVRAWPYSGESVYPRGPWWHYVSVLPWVVGPLLAVCLIPGWVVMLRPLLDRPTRLFKRVGEDHLLRCRLLVGGLTLSVFAGYSLLHWRGWIASSGEPRYLLIVSPLLAVVIARGFELCFPKRVDRRWVVAAAVPVALIPMAVAIHQRGVPIRFGQDMYDARVIFEWYDSTLRDDFPRIETAHPGLSYWAGRPLAGLNRPVIERRPPGTLLVWHELYASFNASADQVIPLELLLVHGWHEIDLPADVREPDWRVFTSESPDAEFEAN